jgi:hypothetical protein
VSNNFYFFAKLDWTFKLTVVGNVVQELSFRSKPNVWAYFSVKLHPICSL